MRIKKECILILLRSFRREFQHIMKKQAKNQLLEIRLDGLINDSIADNNKKNGKNTFIITFLNHKNILKFWPDICWDHKIVKTKRKLEWKKKKKKKGPLPRYDCISGLYVERFISWLFIYHHVKKKKKFDPRSAILQFHHFHHQDIAFLIWSIWPPYLWFSQKQMVKPCFFVTFYFIITQQTFLVFRDVLKTSSA